MKKSQQAAERFQAIVDGVRKHGLSAEVEQVQEMLALTEQPALQGEMARLLAFYWVRQQDFPRALHFGELAVQRLPSSFDSHYNRIYALFKLGRLEQAVQHCRQALALLGEDARWHNMLATSLGALGRLAESRVHGTRSLELKDAQTHGVPGIDMSKVPVPAFDARKPQQNVISFSLFGALPKYNEGAVHNAIAARYVYPGWRCRFWVDDSVPQATRQALLGNGADVVSVQGLPAAQWGTMWRFLVADDARVQRYLVRDTDSVVNVREAAAVQEWLASGRHFHVMRDHYDHAELVLAGMWGGVRGALPAVRHNAEGFMNHSAEVLGRTADQQFLRQALWPTIRQSVLAHDSQFSFGGSRDFPAWALLPPGHHVGGSAMALLQPAAAFNAQMQSPAPAA